MNLRALFLQPAQIESLRRSLPAQLEAELARRGITKTQALSYDRSRSNLSGFARVLIDFRDGKIYPDQLLSRCEELLSLKLPLHPVCPNHQAPGQYFLDAISSRGGENTIVLANRGGGKTQITGLISLIESVIYAGCKTRVLGGSETQSLGLYDHCKEFIRLGELNALVDGEPLTTRVTFRNRSRMSILAASQKSVRGPHGPRLVLDELDEIDPAIYRAALPILQSDASLPAVLRILSTMNYAGGLMSRVMDQAIESGQKTYTWCIFDVMERCEGLECEACVLWEDCQGKAKEADGYYRIDDAIKLLLAPGFDRDDWESQMLCLKPGRKSLVWPGYDEQVHLHLVGADFDPREFRKRFKRVLAGVDWGYENPAAIIVVGEDGNGRIWAIEEYYRSHMLPEELAEPAKELRDRWGIERFYCDPEDPGAIETWRRKGLKVARAKNNLARGVAAVASRFQLLPPHRLPRIYVLSTLANLRHEIKGYRRRGDIVTGRNLRGDEAKEDIIKKDNHGCDAFRYAIMAFDRPGYAGGY